MNKSYTTEIIIMGAGLAGLTLACLLESHYKIIVLERGFHPRQRVSAVNSFSVQVWKELGLWKDEELQPSAYRHMHVWDHCGGVIHFDSPSLSNEPLGYIVDDQRLHDSLLARLRQSTRVRLFLEEECVDLMSHDEGVCVQTQESRFYAHYLIGCDGAQSWVRERGDFAMRSWSYDHTAITCHVVTEKSHRHTAWQKFTEDGPVAFLPLHAIHHSAVVWSLPPERAKILVHADDKEFIRELQYAFDSSLGEITHIGPRYSFPLTMRHVKDYVKNRVILCADAAHTIHPLAGQGLNLAMQDIIALRDAFLAIHEGVGVVRALRQFERKRKAENWQMILILEAIKRSFSIKMPVCQSLLGSSVTLLDKCSSLKSLMLKLASGFNPT